MNNKINGLHEKCLRIIYDDNTSSSTHLLAEDGFITIDTRNLQLLATEMFKVHVDRTNAGIFCVRHAHYNLRNPRQISDLLYGT